MPPNTTATVVHAYLGTPGPDNPAICGDGSGGDVPDVNVVHCDACLVLIEAFNL